MNDYLRILDDDESHDAKLEDATSMLLSEDMIMDWLIELDLDDVDLHPKRNQRRNEDPNDS